MIPGFFYRGWDRMNTDGKQTDITAELQLKIEDGELKKVGPRSEGSILTPL